MVETVPEPEARGPTGRIVVLGASNVARCLPTIVETARRAWYPPLDVMVATGYGRSYGQDSTVLGRRLPGIVSCGLWDALAQRPPLPTAALITDIGNDLVYGLPSEQIIQWLETCLDRLADRVERLVITQLPIESIETAAPWTIRLLGRLFYPFSSVNREHLLREADAINRWLVSCCNRHRAYVVHPNPEWYGWDPIHIARSRQAVAWRTILALWSDGRTPQPNNPPRARRRAVRRARPLVRHIFGMQRRCEQPSVQLDDQTTISMY